MKYLFFASILASVLPILATAADTGARRAAEDRSDTYHVIGPLGASQLQEIQKVSRSVLSAKRGQVSDAEQIALRDEVKALSVSIDQALAPQAGSVMLLNKGSAKLSAQESRISARGEEDRFAIVRSHLSSLRTRNRQTTEHQRESHVDTVRTEDLVAKVNKLDKEVQAALDAPTEERFAKLRELRSRLQIKGQDEEMMELRAKADAHQKESQKEKDSNKDSDDKKQFEPPAETPTISTIVKHR